MTVKIKSALLLLCGLLTSCDLSPNQVVGTYTDTLFSVKETLTLRSDGSFLQKLSMPSGQTLQLTNRWRLQGEVVELRSYLHFYGTGFPKALQDPPQEVSFMSYRFKNDGLTSDLGDAVYLLKRVN